MSAKKHYAFRDMTCLLSTVLEKAKENSALNGILEQKVKRVHVEFFPGENQRKPHVVLRLLIQKGGNVMALQQDGNWESAGSCMFDSNNRQQVDGLDPGVVFRVHKVFKGQTWEMHRDSIISFMYDVEPVHTIKDYVDVVLGKHKDLPDGHKSNLSLFDLAGVDEKTLDGCRDVVSQWVIRLHRMGFMNWAADRIMLDDKVQCENFPQEFHKFIARGFKDLQTGLNRLGTSSLAKMTEHDIPMRFGRFQDLTVERIICYGDFTLPYGFPTATRTETRGNCLIVPCPSTAVDLQQ
ncbi:unnamed protein product [Clonostachys solani]|uniref:Uncharacterized protein n=1 Tax=Clonostachys solani TaxID=160281 RepID=A0A9N9ZMQ6_9HYPO|nr:unnamed protein product [Clonostachys solani]